MAFEVIFFIVFFKNQYFSGYFFPYKTLFSVTFAVKYLINHQSFNTIYYEKEPYFQQQEHSVVTVCLLNFQLFFLHALDVIVQR